MDRSDLSREGNLPQLISRSAASPLERAARTMGFDSAEIRFDTEKSSDTMIHSNFRFFFSGPNGVSVSHNLLSYGQKRLLAFLAYAQDCRDVIIADELVNGLHHEWIETCLDTIGDRQAFLTSQNPVLMDFMQFDSAEDVRRSFVLCDREGDEEMRGPPSRSSQAPGSALIISRSRSPVDHSDLVPLQ
jgi:hypothetical protein